MWVLEMQELHDIVARARSRPLSEEECAKLLASLSTLGWLHQELGQQTLTLARLRSLFGLSTSEKTRDVLADQPDEKAERENERLEEECAAKGLEKPKGHGRNAASDYAGAERISVTHGSLSGGDPCPRCPTNKRGKVYVLGEPHTLVRVVGQAPLRATVFELETLRCNLCGV